MYYRYASTIQSLQWNCKSQLDLPDYVTKSDIEKTRGVCTSFANKVDLISLRSELGKIDIIKLQSVPTDLSDLKSDIDKSDVDKLKTVFIDL